MSEKTAKKTKPKIQKTVVKKPKILPEDAKTRKKPKYKSFRPHKRVKHHDKPLPAWWTISAKAVALMRANFRQLLWFFVVYGLLYLVFVRGFVSPVNIDELKENVELLSGGSTLTSNVTVMSILLNTSISVGGDVSGLYQMIFLLTASLALIWLYRQQQAGNKVSLKDAYYRGMYPIVPFTLIIILIGIQTIPATIGNFLYTTVSNGGLAATFLEEIVWLFLYLATITLSLYLISSSLIALFIVTLPEMTPVSALRKAKELVNFRRASIFRKILALLLISITGLVAFVLPALFVSSLLAQIVFFIVTVLLVPFIVAFLFVLYRELL